MDPQFDSLAGYRAPRLPHVGPLPPASAGRQFSSWLSGLGMLPSQADNWGTAASLTPMAGAYQGGQDFGHALNEGNPWGMAGGAAQVGLSALPLAAFGRAAPRGPSLSFTAHDVERFLQQQGAVNPRAQTHGAWGTNYVNFNTAAEPGRRNRYTVRVPEDMHAAHLERRHDPRLLDAGNVYQGQPVRTPTNHSSSGAPYSNWDVLTGELRRIMGTDKPKAHDPLDSVRRGLKASIK